MEDATIIDFTGRDAVTDPLADLLRKGARDLLQAAIETERDAFLAEFAERRTADGRAGVVGNGYHPERVVQTGIGPVTVKVPKLRAKDDKPVTFRSALVPPYVRKAKSIEAALPWLYLKGISTGEIGAALKMLLGSDATGFSTRTISRLKGQWAAEYETWRKTDLSTDERRWKRFLGRHAGSVAGCTNSVMYSITCPRELSQKPRKCYTTYGRLRRATMPMPRSTFHRNLRGQILQSH